MLPTERNFWAISMGVILVIGAESQRSDLVSIPNSLRVQMILSRPTESTSLLCRRAFSSENASLKVIGLPPCLAGNRCDVSVSPSYAPFSRGECSSRDHGQHNFEIASSAFPFSYSRGDVCFDFSCPGLQDDEVRLIPCLPIRLISRFALLCSSGSRDVRMSSGVSFERSVFTLRESLTSSTKAVARTGAGPGF